MQQRKQVQTVDSYAERGTAQPQPDYTPVTTLARRQTFVPAAPQAAPVPDFAPVQGLDVVSPATSHVQLHTSYEDRSRGFLWAIAPVAAVVGVLSCVAGATLFAVPPLSFAILMWFLTAFCVTWAVGFALHTAASPDGVLLFSTWQLWRTVQREQRHRHERYWTAREDSRRDGRP